MRASHAGLLASLLLPALAACKEETRAAAPRPVRTETVTLRPAEDSRLVVGEIRPRREADLGFRVGGKLLARPAEMGAIVRRGDLLARLDDQDYRNKLRAAEADLAAAAAAVAEVQASEGRTRALLASGTATRASFDVAVKNRRAAEANLDSAQAALDLARDQLRYTELRAEADGVVTAVGPEPGKVMNAGEMAVRIAPPAERDAVFAIPEPAFTAAEAPVFRVALLSDPSVAVEGTVREIAPVADPATRTYLVKVALAEAPAQMRFGAAVSGRLQARGAPVATLPGSALFDRQGRPAVWVYRRQDGTVALKEVTLARYAGDQVQVASGLAEGEIVVTAGVNRLHEGQKVRLMDGARS